MVGAFNSSGNFMHQCNSDMAWEALKKLDFYVENNLWHTPGGTVCDIKMPAAHFLELNSPRSSQGASGAMGGTIKCIEPPGEAKFDGEIIEMLYKEKGVPYNVIPIAPEYPTIDQMLDMSVMAFEPEGWNKFNERFQEHGWWDCKEVEPEIWGTYRRYQTGAIRARTAVGFVGTVGDWLPGFYTPTRKVEIWSTVMESFHPDRPVEPAHLHRAAPLAREPTPRCSPSTRSSSPPAAASRCTSTREHRQLPWCRELWPAPRVEINPDDCQGVRHRAGRLGVDRDPLRQDPRGSATSTTASRKGTINCEHQWWYPGAQDQTRQGPRAVRRQPSNRPLGPATPTAAPPTCAPTWARSTRPRRRTRPFGNPVPCGHDGTEIIHDASDPRLKEWLPVYEGREA